MVPTMGFPPSRVAVKFVGLAVVLMCLIFPIIYSCSLPNKPRRANTSLPLRILPLGDSITWGWQPTNQESGTDGYRADLLRDLIREWYESVDFIGTQRSGWMADNDNEGHSGFTINHIRDVMGKSLEMRPNVVLLHAGTNDLNRPEKEEKWEDAPRRLGELIDKVLEVCPDAVVLVAKIIPAEKTQTLANIEIFNDAIAGLVEERVEKLFKLMVVDQSVLEVDELVDGLHPCYGGEFKGPHYAARGASLTALHIKAYLNAVKHGASL